ncbi:MAG: UDP-N-acetylmuramate--L-alanine ligase [Candidatus Bipolaricaulota bacterium]|nr:UDP-N-acetylmuramate--L-alanine ligase [Candidatus Bipolaricaulota bacterium]
MSTEFLRVHLVGIAGDGMAGLARLLWQGGAEVSGSDLCPSPKLREVAEWAEVRVGHAPANLPAALDALVFSSAVRPDNPELCAVRGRVPLFPRLYALRRLWAGRDLVAVVGTHGKTTTTTWLTHLLRQSGLVPGHYIGGQVPGLPCASWGRDRLFVAEVDESDGRFVHLSPKLAVLTSVDTDHLGTYRGFSGLQRAFAAFLARAERAVVAWDDPAVRAIARAARARLSFGLEKGADFQARGLRFRGERAFFELWAFGRSWGEVEVPGPGVHNVRNALAALAAGHALGLSLPEMMAHLPSAPRPRRRLEILEENGYLVVDDYAHHPTELAAGLSALRRGWPGRRIVAVFQPHRYTRTALLAEAFGAVLARADWAVVTEVYPAFEAPQPGVSGRRVAEAARRHGGRALFRPHLLQALDTAAALIRPGDIVVCFGAGDIWKLSREMARALSSGS